MSEEKLLFLLCFISETYQRKPNKNYFSSFSVFHTETECCTIMAIWGRRNVFSVYHMFLQTVVKVMFACSNVVVFCSLTGKKKKDADSAAGIKQCKRSCLPHHWLLQTVRGCGCLHIYLGREKTATAPCLSWRRLICQRMGRKWVDHPAVLVLFPLKNSVMLEQ